MIKSAIEHIQNTMAARVVEIDGAEFVLDRDGNTTQVQAHRKFPRTFTCYSLDSLVQMIKRETIDMHGRDRVFVNIPDPRKVQCFTDSQESKNNERGLIYEATDVDSAGWKEDVTLGFEEASIALRSRFAATDDTEYALRLLSEVTTGAKITYNDNGIATTVVTKKGIDLQSNQTIKPIIKLRPYRTFQEIEQPQSEFLIRLTERGIKFVEADGGMWKLQAKKKIYEFLEFALATEIKDGKVVLAL